MRSWLLTGVLVLGGVSLILDVAPDARVLQTAVRGYPLVLLAAVVGLAWRFERSRLAWAAVLIGAVRAALALVPAAHWADMFSATTVLVPLTIAGLLFARDRALGTPRGLMQLVLVLGVPAVGVALVLARIPALDAPLWLLRVRPVAGDVLALSRPAMLAFLVAAAVACVLVVRRRRAEEAGLLLLLVPLLLMLESGAQGPARGAWLLACGAVLALAVVESAFAIAYRDELTGVPSRRALSSALRRVRTPYAIAVVDIDHFKKVNDRYGHETGDQVLRMVASRLARVRGGRVYRSGGEEFTMLFPGMDGAKAYERVDDMRRSIQDASFRLRSSDRPKRKPRRRSKRAGTPANGASSTPSAKALAVTVSAGVAAAGTRDTDPGLVVAAADRALYTAKRAGRNRTAGAGSRGPRPTVAR